MGDGLNLNLTSINIGGGNWTLGAATNVAGANSPVTVDGSELLDPGQVTGLTPECLDTSHLGINNLLTLDESFPTAGDMYAVSANGTTRDIEPSSNEDAKKSEKETQLEQKKAERTELEESIKAKDSEFKDANGKIEPAKQEYNTKTEEHSKASDERHTAFMKASDAQSALFNAEMEKPRDKTKVDGLKENATKATTEATNAKEKEQEAQKNLEEANTKYKGALTESQTKYKELETSRAKLPALNQEITKLEEEVKAEKAVTNEKKEGSTPQPAAPSGSSTPQPAAPQAAAPHEAAHQAAAPHEAAHQAAAPHEAAHQAAAPQPAANEHPNTFTLNDKNVTPAMKSTYGYKLEDGENGSKLSFDPDGWFTILEAKSFEANGKEKASESSNSLAGIIFQGSDYAMKSDGNVANIELSEPNNSIGHKLKIRVNNKDGSYQEMTLKKEGTR